MVVGRLRPRVLAALWLILGVAVWNGFFDLYVSRGAREYGQLKAEFDLGHGSAVSMDAVMRRAARDGLVMASLWAGLVVGAGWTTIWVTQRRSR